MKLVLTILFSIVLINAVSAQSERDSIDKKYLEDQIYISLTYNLITAKLPQFKQNGLSGGYSVGFIKDIPLNSNRNIGLAIGSGYLYQVFNNNLQISNSNNVTDFNIASNFDKNNLKISMIEFPFEIRWRNSSPVKYKFWRVYGGFKVAYVLKSSSYYKDSASIIRTGNIPELNKWKFGLTLATGFSTWNLYVYYSLNPLFKNAKLNGEAINSKELSVGLKFYIL